MCKLGGNVAKEDAVKINGCYYHKECNTERVIKQEIEAYYIENMPVCAISLLRKVINQLIYTNQYSAEYVLFIVKKIHINNLKINNPFGLGSYCNEGRNITEWKNIKINIEFKGIKDQIIQGNSENKVKFTYNPDGKKWTDLI